jgi:hypothetical protein
MKNTIRVLLLFLALPVFAACSTIFSFYPVEGPLSKAIPLPIIKASVTELYKNTGGITLTMPDAESCSGQWSIAGGSTSTFTSGTMYTRYGPVYMSGMTTYPMGGVTPGQAILTCNRGTLIEVEFYTGNGVSNGFGFAKDNKGNVFKLLF